MTIMMMTTKNSNTEYGGAAHADYMIDDDE